VAHRNWSRLDATWHPIDLLPAKMPAAILFANAEQTHQWLVESPKGATSGHRQDHRRDERGEFMFDQAGKPVTTDEAMEAAFFAFVVLHDKATG
jgi:predicted DsbA family dithiol-disulfide isomerase